MVLVRVNSRTKTIDVNYEYFIVPIIRSQATASDLVLMLGYNFLEFFYRYFFLFNRDIVLNVL